MSWLMLGSAFGCVGGERYVFVNHSIASCNRDDAELRKYPHLNGAVWMRVVKEGVARHVMSDHWCELE